ncbi:ATP-binding protein [Microbacterium sp. Marseille-Q6965]|uniref:ATP-binding protein n=1 Tax=Microbacterium sp. Marseille-Q6965 TaxID=2965072 RepID=UPI0021B7A949|nr:GHKL domain-containing protein [Microbacterium sp. Marseille-Q6965]
MIGEALPDIPRLCTGIAEWGACVVYLVIVRRRVGLLPLLGILVVGLGALVATQLLADALPLPLWTVGMLAAVLVMLVFLRVSVAGGWATTAYLTARAFVLAELVASLHWQLHTYFFATAQLTPPAIALLAATYGACFAVAGVAEGRHLPREETLEVGWREVISAGAIAAATFALSNLSFVNANTPFSGRLGPEIFYIRTLVDLCGYIALYAQQEWRMELRSRAQTQAMQSLLRSQHEQYRATKRAIEDTGRKHHDMKHAIEAIRAESDPGARARLVDELERSFADDGALFHTGSAVLDAVLHAKATVAREDGVEITCVADGSLLHGMSDLDVVAVVGNALDNAIENTRRVDDPDSRTVRVALFAQDDFVMLRLENTFDGVLHRSDGRIVSRKGRRADHGYGLRSIQQTVERYGGTVSISADERWFSLRILLPSPTSHPLKAS